MTLLFLNFVSHRIISDGRVMSRYIKQVYQHCDSSSSAAGSMQSGHSRDGSCTSVVCEHCRRSWAKTRSATIISGLERLLQPSFHLKIRLFGHCKRPTFLKVLSTLAGVVVHLNQLSPKIVVSLVHVRICCNSCTQIIGHVETQARLVLHQIVVYLLQVFHMSRMNSTHAKIVACYLIRLMHVLYTFRLKIHARKLRCMPPHQTDACLSYLSFKHPIMHSGRTGQPECAACS